MNDKTYATQRQRVSKELDRWIPRLFALGEWEFTIHYLRDGIPPLPTDSPLTSVNADVQVLWAYQRAVIRFSMPQIKGLDKGELRRCVCHELCHCLIAPAEQPEKTPEYLDRLELAVCAVHRVLLRAYQTQDGL